MAASVDESEPYARLTEIDGLRGLAVLLVMLFHARVLLAGWIGVWLFLGISGFVITRSTLSRLGGGPFGWDECRQFLLRRFFRIVPAYGAVVIAGALVLALLNSVSAGAIYSDGSVHRWSDYRAQLPYILSFSFNFYRMVDDFHWTPLFIHFWSLSFENQFYLVFPLILMGLGRVGLMRVATLLIFCAPIIRLIAGMALSRTMPPDWAAHADVWRGRELYLCPFTQLDSFAWGIGLALIEHAVSRVLVAVAAISLSVCWVAYWAIWGRFLPALGLAPDLFDIWLEVVLFGLLSATAVLLIAAIVARIPFVLELFGAPWLLRLGERSYAFYLWHFPIQFMLGVVLSAIPFLGWFGEEVPPSTALPAAAGFPGIITAPIVYLLTYWVAGLSWRWIEQPAQAIGSRLMRRLVPA